MRSLFAVIRELVIPAGSPATAPSIILSADVPPELTAYYAVELASVNAYQAWRFSSTKYHYLANVFNAANSFVCFGHYDGTDVKELWRSPITLAGSTRVVFGQREDNVGLLINNTGFVTTENATITDTTTAGTTTSAAYALMPGTPTRTITKHYDENSTDCLLQFVYPMKSTATATDVRIGVRITGALGFTADVEILRFTFEVANVTLPLNAMLRIDNLVADDYDFQLIWRRNGGAGTVTTTTAYTYSLHVREVDD